MKGSVVRREQSHPRAHGRRRVGAVASRSAWRSSRPALLRAPRCAALPGRGRGRSGALLLQRESSRHKSTQGSNSLGGDEEFLLPCTLECSSSETEVVSFSHPDGAGQVSVPLPLPLEMCLCRDAHLRWPRSCFKTQGTIAVVTAAVLGTDFPVMTFASACVHLGL